MDTLLQVLIEYVAQTQTQQHTIRLQRQELDVAHATVAHLRGRVETLEASNARFATLLLQTMFQRPEDLVGGGAADELGIREEVDDVRMPENALAEEPVQGHRLEDGGNGEDVIEDRGLADIWGKTRLILLSFTHPFLLTDMHKDELFDVGVHEPQQGGSADRGGDAEEVDYSGKTSLLGHCSLSLTHAHTALFSDLEDEEEAEKGQSVDGGGSSGEVDYSGKTSLLVHSYSSLTHVHTEFLVDSDDEAKVQHGQDVEWGGSVGLNAAGAGT
ncbi:hypothetical protein HDU98_004144 [Podochytrium sp. JEL0797]|nr:hypothetical protein HDU98_004144 [Podochytrium sp. JEL0797]